MREHEKYLAAPPGEVYWRHEKCPHRGTQVLLKTIGGVLVKGHWYGELNQYFTAWCPMPKDQPPAPQND